MWSVGCGMGHASREYFSHGSRRSTQKPFGCLSITQIAPPARQIDADLFAGGEGFIMWSVESVENVECGIWNLEC